MGWLARLGLHRPELRAWALYDWANSGFVTIVVTAVFPPWFMWVAEPELAGAVATARYAFATTVALTLVALLAPVLGVLADRKPIKKKLLLAFMGVGVAATVAMAFIERGQWAFALATFVLGNLGVAGSFVFYDALLPHLVQGDEMDRLSTAGYALGYLGGGLLLALCLVLLQHPTRFGLADVDAAARASYVAVAVWWAGFSVPLFVRVREPDVVLANLPEARPVRAAALGVVGAVRDLSRLRHALRMLLAFLFYNEGIQTIIRMAAIYGTEIGIDRGTLMGAILLVQFVGIPCTFGFGLLATHVHTKAAILLGVSVYGVIAVVGWSMQAAWQFWLLAALVALVQGGTQALSRSLFASLVPKHQATEMFGLFAVFEKFAGIFGPLLFGSIVSLTGSTRDAILSVIALFVIGGGLLLSVDVEAGRRLREVVEREALARGA